MSGFQKAMGVIRANRRSYIAMNAIYYGLVVFGMIVAAVDQSLQQRLLDQLGAAFKIGLLRVVSDAYRSGNVPLAALVTFLVNSLLGAFAFLTLPSAAIPFAGCLAGCYRAVLWGLTMSPTNPKMLLVMLPHSVVLLLEGQGYVLAAFGAWLWGKWFLRPGRSGFASRGAGYRAGLRANLDLYRLILPVLAVSAVYEAVEVIGAMALLRR
jgi:hypothetical protein